MRALRAKSPLDLPKTRFQPISITRVAIPTRPQTIGDLS